MTEVPRCSCWHKNFVPKVLSTPAPGLYTCIKSCKMCIKSDFKEIFVKLVANDRSGKRFLLTSKFCPLGVVCPRPAAFHPGLFGPRRFAPGRFRPGRFAPLPDILGSGRFTPCLFGPGRFAPWYFGPGYFAPWDFGPGRFAPRTFHHGTF